MKYFVSSDIHGFYNEWISALNEIGFDTNNQDHSLIICGDVFDRGQQAQQLLDFLVDFSKQYPERLILIRGNHEDLFEHCLSQLINGVNISAHHWTNGTLNTIAQLTKTNQYDLVCGIYEVKDILQQTKDYVDLMKNSLDFYETQNHIFVHGWIPTKTYRFQHIYKEDWRFATKQEWELARWDSCLEMYKHGVFEPGKTIVAGHWHCSALWHYKSPKEYTSEFGKKANHTPFYDEGILAIDTCTAHTNKVNVVVIEDNPK